MVRICAPVTQENARSCAKPEPNCAVQPLVSPTSLAVAAALLLVSLCSACGGTGAGKPTMPERQVVEMDELRISAARGQQGYQLDAYDAADLFKRATDLLNQKKCREAVELYDRLVKEFESSRYTSASLYNAGLCLQALGDFAGS